MTQLRKPAEVIKLHVCEQPHDGTVNQERKEFLNTIVDILRGIKKLPHL